MVQLKISGRLGNQLFQYATVQNYLQQNKIKEPIYISFEEMKKYANEGKKGFEDSLKLFHTNYIVEEKITFKWKQFFIYHLFRCYKKMKKIWLRCRNKDLDQQQLHQMKLKWKKRLNQVGIFYYFPGDFDFYETTEENKIFIGSFESSKFFKDIQSVLQTEYEPKFLKLHENEQLYQKIVETNSICVTIRRGDFLDKKYKNYFYVCHEGYFKEAIKKMQEMVKDPQFVVFSDDVEWCKKHMSFPEGTIFESGKDPVWEKLRLMYSCKHFIISNSTFSWWAQYLSRNENKIVIAPSKWRNYGYCEDIFEDNWIKIEV